MSSCFSRMDSDEVTLLSLSANILYLDINIATPDFLLFNFLDTSFFHPLLSTCVFLFVVHLL